MPNSYFKAFLQYGRAFLSSELLLILLSVFKNTEQFQAISSKSDSLSIDRAKQIAFKKFFFI